MRITRMEVIKREKPFDAQYNTDIVEIDVSVALYTLLVEDFYEFLKKFPKTLKDDYGDEYKTSINEALQEFVLLKQNEQDILEFYCGKGNDTKYYKLEYAHEAYLKGTPTNDREVTFTYRWYVNTEAPF